MTQEQKRIKIAETCGIDVCGSCFNAIDPECCCCGSPIEGHSQYDGHSPVPMGCRCGYDKQPQPRWGGVPDYLNDLNAMHEAENMLSDEQRAEYSETLFDVACERQSRTGEWAYVTSPACDRAEAFGRTLNLWTE